MNAPNPVPLNTVWGVHLNAVANGFDYYNVTVLRRPQLRLRNTRVWLVVEDVNLAEQRFSKHWKEARVKLWKAAQDRITLNVTNTFHWNPLPQGVELRWNDIVLTRLDPPDNP